ncbi:MAG: NAD(P)-dependent oxidoreductase [Deltaproteobacteria bacterium]|nr:NAD(P)-dependent oxidoreductase [Deltaproteobacteria bacterium]
MSRILIAGCGYVGCRLAAELVLAGHEVHGLRREGALPEGVHAVHADLLDGAALARALPGGLDVAVYAASPGERSDAAYERTFVTAPSKLREVLERSSPGLSRVLFVSSTAVYAQARGEVVDERAATEPLHFTGRRLLEGERGATAWPGQACAVRLAGIYGPGRAGLVDRVRRGEATFAPGPPRYRNRIHRDDAAGLLAHLLGLPGLPPVILGVDDAPVPEREVLEWLASRLGAPAPRAGEPAPGSRGAAGNRRGCNDLLRSTGYVLRYPTYREGYGALLSDHLLA